MKNVIFYFSLIVCTLGLFLCIGSANDSTISPYLAGWVLFQGLFYLYLGRRMMLDIADYRIAAVLLFVLGQIIMWLNWAKSTEMEEVGFAFGVILIWTGFLWGFSDHYAKQEILESKKADR